MVLTDMSRNDILSIIGFLLFLIGFTTLFLGIVGVQLSFLSFLERINGTTSLLIKLGMIITGIILVFQAKTTIRK
jgi:uncharacterized membrane protein